MKSLINSSIALALISGQTQAQQASITPLPGYNTFASAVSADGRTIAGHIAVTAVRWTASSGMVELPRLPGHSMSTAGVSDNGLVIVGVGSSAGVMAACRWDTDGVTAMWSGGGCMAASSDGSTLVGYQYVTTYPQPTTARAVRWTTGLGLQQLPLPAGFVNSEASDICADGSVIVGSVSNLGEPNHAVKWSESGTPQVLFQNPAGATSVVAKKVSADGRVIVGTIFTPYFRAFRWSVDGGLSEIDSPTQFQPFSISANGAIVVGNDGGSNALRWSRTSGTVFLKAYLQSYGADVSGWSQLADATDVSADGRTIVGRGTFNGQPTGFVAVAPLECPGDLFADRLVNGADLGVLLSQWGSSGAGVVSDINRDGSVDGADLGTLLSNWGACP